MELCFTMNSLFVMCCFILWTRFSESRIPNDWTHRDAGGGSPSFKNPLHPTYYQDMSADNPRFKVEHQGSLLKRHVQALKDTENQQVDVVFLVDSSASVGASNFRDELKFVKKLLSDFTVDENNTHVCVVTFSSRSKIVRHVDYVSHPSRDQHKCSLLQDDLPKIRYTGGGTYTLGAFREARKVLSHARKNATKAVFLITDGFSNGGDPIPEARALREKGVKIFTFGIRNGNIVELYHMASEPKNETCYILDSFEEFEAMARRALHEDLQSGQYLLERPRRCGRLCETGRDCCDKMAICMCGTYTGKYQCVCPAGYYGSGLTGGCIPCPSGSYKPYRLPGSEETCLPCPDNNHVTEPGSTTVNNCTCKTGFRKVGQKCAVLECPVLPSPSNGYFVQEKCDSVFNAACGIRCHPGYELHGSSVRMCQENGSWTGAETLCRMKTCPPLVSPKNGNMICTKDDYSYKTICRFTCDEGYKLVGSRKRSCLAISFWTGITTRCREITCSPLPQIKDGKILPKLCTAKDVWFGITCHMSCHHGYTLVGPHTKLCTPEGTWTPGSSDPHNECVDTSAPLMFCPPDIETETDAEKDGALVIWQNPVAIDNSGYIPSISAVPAVISPVKFPIGITTVRYTAEDLNKNTASCSFVVTVTDNEPPRVDRCVSPATFITRSEYANVTWDEPIFSDNSQENVTVTSTHSPGQFPRGEVTVIYTAVDKFGNNNTCHLNIKVKEHKCDSPPAPANGNKTCHEGETSVDCVLSCMEGYDFAMPAAPKYHCVYEEGVWYPEDKMPFPDCSGYIPPNKTCHEGKTSVDCVLSCMEGYDFAMPAAPKYHCVYEEGVWYPEDKMPFPDCSVVQVSKDATQPATVTFMGHISCRERRIIHKMEKDFEVSVSKRVNDLCTDNAVCTVDQVETTCEEDDDFNVLTVRLERKKRSAPNKKRIFKTKVSKKVPKKFYKKKSPVKKKKSSESIITFDFMLEGSVDTTGNGTEDKKRQKALMTNLQMILKVLQEEAEAGMFDINLENKRLLYENMIFKHIQPKLKCRQGSILKNNVCVFCPIGTFFNVVSETCESCGQGTYQPKQGTITCMVCPGNHTSTPLNNSKSALECKAQCLPGSFSFDGLEICETCDIGYFQSEYAQSECLPCPDNKTTVWRGKRQISDCRLKCEPGYVSKTGLEPCLPCPKGTYQSEVGMSACFRCPGDGSTKRTGCDDLRDCEGDWDLQNDPFKKGGFGQSQLPSIPVNPCFDKPCKNGGKCSYQPPFNYKCKCPPGYGGIICESEIDECKLKPCLNGGICEDKQADYSCVCAPGFTGKKCERDLDDCESNPCQNGGVCGDQANSYTCDCKTGFQGTNCDTDVNECLTNPCRNNAKCVDLPGDFECVCPEGFEGDICELNLDECSAKPCRNNATCYDAANGFRCTCLPGFAGESCEEDIDECASSPCLHQATCIDEVNKYTCQCLPGFGGDKCEDVLQSDFNLVFTKGGTTDYGRVELRQDLTQFTICFWMQSNDNENYGTPFSYATRGIDNAITITDYNGFSLNVNGENVTTDVSANDGQWHHICFTWSNIRGTFKIYRDGLLLDSGNNLAKGQTVQGGGFIVVGQEQDSYGGGFSETESFIGQLTGVNVWDEELNYSQIEDMLTNCEQVAIGSAVAWPDFIGSLKGKLEKSQSTFCKECPIPVKPSYGAVDYTGTTAGEVATYTCLRGFELSGRDRRKCLVAGEWEDLAPKCERVNCGSPGRIRNGYTRGSRFSFDNRVRFICYQGFQLSGPETRYCNEFGFWEGDQPTCEEIACELPEISLNTKVKNPKDKYKPGDTVSFYCTPGNKLFTLHDNVACQRDGSWDKSVPTCDSIRCKDPKDVEKGFVENKQLEYSVGFILKYSCVFGYRFSTSVSNTKGQIRCLASGLWEENLPVCEIVTCSSPSYIQNADIIGENRTFLSTVQYSCHEGYVLSGSTTLECLETGVWDPRPPSCKPVECGRPEKPENSIQRATSFKYRSTVLYLCKAGFTMVGEKTRTCLANGTWSGTLPECVAAFCGPPEAIERGSYTGEVFTYGNIVLYSCGVGFALQGLERRVCTLDGSWEGKPPSCVIIECIAPPGIQNGYYKGSAFFYEDTVLYECDDGYELNGEEALTCTENRTWVPNVPVCDPVSCPVPEDLLNGKVGTTGLVYGKRAEYSCKDFYYIQGDLTRTCTADGLWSGQSPVCVASGCTEPLDIIDGGYNYTDFNINSKISYFCDDGYFLTGNPIRECLFNLSWSYEEPRCDPVLCSDPLSPLNGRVIVISKQYQASVTYECDPGFILDGVDRRSCSAEAEWSGETPQCRPLKCNSPGRVISNGRMIGDNFTYSSVVRYECDPGYNIDGPTDRTCLQDGTWDNPIPICEIVKCPRPLRVINGGYNGFVLDFNTSWNVTCQKGYMLLGESQRTCLANGTWSGFDPECRLIDCGPLTDVPFGVVSLDKTTLDGAAVYFCDPGYSIVGPSERFCEENSYWSGSEPSCESNSCGDPNVYIANGAIILNGTTFGDSVQFTCINAGYILEGPEFISCSENGSWTGSIPECKPVSCGDPEDNQLELFTFVNGTTFGGFVLHSCEEGYVLNGPESRDCTEFGTWSGDQPVCEIVKCSAPSTIYNGTVELFGNLTYQSEIVYSCVQGFRLLGPRYRRCLAAGYWSKEPPSCKLIDCGVLYAPFNGKLELLETTYNASAVYSCNPGYTLIGSSSRLCQISGNWSKSDPFCEVVQCPELPSPDNGYVYISAYTHHANVTYGCDRGYDLIGGETRQCLQSGVWSDEAPFCEIISCSEISFIPYGKVTAGNFTYAESVSFMCDAGFELIGDEEIECLQDGTWSGGGLPNCTIIKCPPPPVILNGSITGDSYVRGDSISYQCDEGFEISGSQVRICTALKLWLGSDPYCEIIRCPTPYRINNGYVNAEGYEYNNTIEYDCHEGYILEGESLRSCLLSKSWSGDAPVCSPIMCPQLPDILFANVAYFEGDVFRNVAEYNCSVGYKLKGYSQVTCLKSGNWSEAEFECVLIECPAITSLFNGYVSGSSFEYSAEILFACATGFNLTGESVLTCLSDGLWDFPLPSCSEISCSDPGLLENGSVEGDSLLAGNQLRFSCFKEYRLVGVQTMLCLDDGEWDDDIPVCELIVCPEPMDLQNGQIIIQSNVTEFRVDEIVEYECDEDYTLIGDDAIICLKTGKWSSSAPFCSQTKCPPPEPIRHGQVFGSEFSYQASVNYSCDIGYELTGYSVRLCLKTGVWDVPAPNCDPIRCRQPVQIGNGNMTVNSMFYGGVAEYECEEGYELIGNATRMCQETKTWSGSEPFCHMITCGQPQIVSHAKIVSNSFPFGSYGVGSYIEYICDEDFEIEGSSVLECLSNRSWSRDSPYCVKKICPQPSGSEISQAQLYIGAVIKNICPDGFVLVGEQFRTCLENLTWSGDEPDCRPVQCPAVTSLLFGTVSGQQFNIGDRLYFTCFKGYRLLGAGAIECLAGGNWNESVPACFKIQCSQPRSILNGGYSGRTFYAGNSVEFFCNPGYIVLGYTESVCNEDGTWSRNVPWCVEPSDCGEPPELQSASITYSSTTFGSTAYYICEEGFDLNGNNIIECGVDGSWVGTLPLCEEISCGPLPVILHATAVITRQSLGTIAEYRCSPGYQSNGEVKVECLASKKWMYDSRVKCLPVDCGSPPSVDRAVAVTNSTTFGATLQYQCHEGYHLVGGSLVSCSWTGAWFGALPECKQDGCGPAPVPHSNVQSFDTPDGLQVSYFCPENMRLVGSSVIVCDEDGVWSDVSPICEENGCGDPPHVSDNNLLVDLDPQIVTYGCPTGYFLRGVSSVVCILGSWSDEAPTCEVLSCRDLQTPVHGSVVTSGENVGKHAVFYCNSGYLLRGSNALTCLSDGRWSGLEPTCLRSSEKIWQQTCDPLPDIPGVLTIPQGLRPGDSFNLHCSQGQVATGSMKVTCLDDRTWTRPEGQCRRIHCGRPPVKDAANVMLMGRSYYYGNRVVFMCRRGLQPIRSPSVLHCQEDGKWDGTAECVAQCKSDCLNGGRCIGSNRCKCMSGYGGARCEIPICILPCLNGGKCIAPYRCKCLPNFGGSRCQSGNRPLDTTVSSFSLINRQLDSTVSSYSLNPGNRQLDTTVSSFSLKNLGNRQHDTTVTSSSLNPGNSQFDTTVSSSSFNPGNSKFDTTVSSSSFNPGNSQFDTTVPSSSFNPGNSQFDTTELSSSFHSGNSQFDTTVSSSSFNPGNSQFDTTVSSSSFNPGNSQFDTTVSSSSFNPGNSQFDTTVSSSSFNPGNSQFDTTVSSSSFNPGNSQLDTTVSSSSFHPTEVVETTTTELAICNPACGDGARCNQQGECTCLPGYIYIAPDCIFDLPKGVIY